MIADGKIAFIKRERGGRREMSFDGGDHFRDLDQWDSVRILQADKDKIAAAGFSLIGARAWRNHKWIALNGSIDIKCTLCGLWLHLVHPDDAANARRDSMLRDYKPGQCHIPWISQSWCVEGVTGKATSIDYGDEQFEMTNVLGWIKFGEGYPFDRVAAIWNYCYRNCPLFP